MATSYTFYDLDTLVSGCAEDFEHIATFYNQHGVVPLELSIDYIDPTSMPGWFTTDVVTTTIDPGASYDITLRFSPSAMGGAIDRLHAQGYFRLIASHQGVPSTADTLYYRVGLALIMDDGDGDLISSECDACPEDGDNDIDGDGLCADVDNCPALPNADQLDTDGDGVGNACDICPADDHADADGDGVPDNCDRCPGQDEDVDNCPARFNQDQLDIDEDLVGDLCDNCVDTYNPDQADEDLNNVGDACDFICGDSNGDENINVGDAVFLINHIFKGGTAPSAFKEGDANCDEAINVGDAVYLINHVFKGGAAPCANCS